MWLLPGFLCNFYNILAFLSVILVEKSVVIFTTLFCVILPLFCCKFYNTTRGLRIKKSLLRGSFPVLNQVPAQNCGGIAKRED